MDEIDTRISPALHPQSVKALDGYTEQTRGCIPLVEAAFTDAYNCAKAVWSAKEAAAKNPTLNAAAQLIQVDDFASKRLAHVARTFDEANAKLRNGIVFLEGELSTPVKDSAGSSLSSEIRAHVVKMTTSERQTFIREAIDAGDEETVSAILGAKHYLTGITPEMQSVLLRQWHSKHQPEKAARLKLMLSARDKLNQDAGKLFSEVQKAVGFLTEPNSQRRIYASDLRKQRDAAEQPFRAAG